MDQFTKNRDPLLANISHNQFIVLFHRKRNMFCLSAHAFTASHHLPFFVIIVAFAVTMISVAIALSTFIGVLLPNEDLHNANSTVDDKAEKSPSSFLLSSNSTVNQSVCPLCKQSRISKVDCVPMTAAVKSKRCYLKAKRPCCSSKVLGLMTHMSEVDCVSTTATLNLKRYYLKAKQPCHSSKVSHKEEMDSGGGDGPPPAEAARGRVGPKR